MLATIARLEVAFIQSTPRTPPPPAILVGTPNSGDRPQLWVLTRGSGKNKTQLPESPLGLGKTKQNLARAIAGHSIDAPSKPPPRIPRKTPGRTWAPTSRSRPKETAPAEAWGPSRPLHWLKSSPPFLDRAWLNLISKTRMAAF